MGKHGNLQSEIKKKVGFSKLDKVKRSKGTLDVKAGAQKSRSSMG